MTPKQASHILRSIAAAGGWPIDELKRLALSIDGPEGQKKDKGNGGQSPPTATLLDVSMSNDGSVVQEWGIYANGQKVSVKSKTDKNGDVEIEGGELDLGKGVTAQQAVAFILQGAHPRYYPKPGKTVTLDSKFLSGTREKYGS